MVALIEKFLSKALIKNSISFIEKEWVANFIPLPVKFPSSIIQKAKETGLKIYKIF